MERLRVFKSLTNPIRLSGLLALLLLLGPGSLHGLVFLLGRAGFVVAAPSVSPQTHGLLQLCGFFMVLIWGFLTHALPGMLGASDVHTRRIRFPMVLMAVDLVALWLVDASAAPRTLLHATMGAGQAITLIGTTILMHATWKAHRRWTHRPFPMLIIPLALFPLAWGLCWARALGWTFSAAGVDLLLLGVVIPIILAMSHRMFAPMIGLQLPRTRLFDVAGMLWAAGVAVRLLEAPFQPSAVAGILMLLGAIGCVVSLRVFESGRSLHSDRAANAHRALHAYMAVAMVCLVASPLVHLLSALGVLPGLLHHWLDVARHLLAVGYGLVVVMGITQRVLPNMVQGRQPSLPWMWANLVLVGGGTLLRFAEPFLPASAPWVRLSAALLYAGVLGFALHLARGLLSRPTLTIPPLITIRSSRAAAPRHP